MSVSEPRQKNPIGFMSTTIGRARRVGHRLQHPSAHSTRIASALRRSLCSTLVPGSVERPRFFTPFEERFIWKSVR